MWRLGSGLWTCSVYVLTANTKLSALARLRRRGRTEAEGHRTPVLLFRRAAGADRCGLGGA
jgi:hypothetical protein